MTMPEYQCKCLSNIRNKTILVSMITLHFGGLLSGKGKQKHTAGNISLLLP